jgi:hypothetical protein
VNFRASLRVRKWSGHIHIHPLDDLLLPASVCSSSDWATRGLLMAGLAQAKLNPSRRKLCGDSNVPSGRGDRDPRALCICAAQIGVKRDPFNGAWSTSGGSKLLRTSALTSALHAINQRSASVPPSPMRCDVPMSRAPARHEVGTPANGEACRRALRAWWGGPVPWRRVD